MRVTSRLARSRMLWATITLSVMVALLAPAASAKPGQPTVRDLRTTIAWHHSIVVDVNRRLAIANGREYGGGRQLVCHTPTSCKRLLAEQRRAHTWAVGAWERLKADNTPAGAQRIVRYRFTICGGPTKAAQAHSIVGWESGWQRWNVNSAGDTSWWQIELPAHLDVSYAQATDAWTSTGIAVRWSRCGEDWSPTWSAVRDHGMPWP